jgi:hypothetical protein
MQYNCTNDTKILLSGPNKLREQVMAKNKTILRKTMFH